MNTGSAMAAWNDWPRENMEFDRATPERMLAALEAGVEVTRDMAEDAHTVLVDSSAVIFTGDYEEAIAITTAALVAALHSSPTAEGAK